MKYSIIIIILALVVMSCQKEPQSQMVPVQPYQQSSLGFSGISIELLRRIGQKTNRAPEFVETDILRKANAQELQALRQFNEKYWKAPLVRMGY